MKIIQANTIIVVLATTTTTMVEAAQRGLRVRSLNPNNSLGNMGNMSSGDPNNSCQSFTSEGSCNGAMDNDGNCCVWSNMNPNNMGMGMSTTDFCGADNNGCSFGSGEGLDGLDDVNEGLDGLDGLNDLNDFNDFNDFNDRLWDENLLDDERAEISSTTEFAGVDDESAAAAGIAAPAEEFQTVLLDADEAAPAEEFQTVLLDAGEAEETKEEYEALQAASSSFSSSSSDE